MDDDGGQDALRSGSEAAGGDDICMLDREFQETRLAVDASEKTWGRSSDTPAEGCILDAV